MGRRHRHLQAALKAPRPLLLAALAVGGCSLNPALDLATTAGPRPVELRHVPFHAQQAHHCGPASLLTVLEASGVAASYDEVVERVYVPGLEGSLRAEMTAATRDFGRIAYELPPEPRAVFAEVAAGRPVLVLLNLGVPSAPVWHYAVVIGYEPAARRVLLRSADRRRQRQRARSWMRRWDWAGRWALAVLRPGEWPAAVERSRLLAALADFEDRAPPAAARHAWTTATERWPAEPMAWLGLGNAAHAAGDGGAAVDAFRHAVALAPDRPAPRLNLAALLTEGGDPCGGVEALGPPPPAEHPLAPRFAELAAAAGAACARASPPPGAW